MALSSTLYPNQRRSVSGTYSVNGLDSVLLCDTSSAAVTINLTTFTAGYWSTQYKLYVVDDSNNAATNNITINPPTGYTINGQSSLVVAVNGESVVISIADNSKYKALSTSGHAIMYSSSVLAQRPLLEFAGAGVSVANSGSKTVVTVSGLGGGEWLLAGNAGTTAGTDFLGTTDNQPVAFKANNAEVMRLLVNGNLGLGTTTPTNDLSFGNDAAKTIWIESTDVATVGRGLTVQAGGTVAGEINSNFAALSQTTRNWVGMAAAPNGNVYACVSGGDIYMQTGGTGNFVALGQTSRQWKGMTAAPNGNVYAGVSGGDIYMQTGGTGNFVALGQTSRTWEGMASVPNGNVYACSYNGLVGEIYMQTGGTGNFVALGQTSRQWRGMAADVSVGANGNVYACVNGGDIYMQTGGTGNFVALGQTSRVWQDMTVAPNGNVYAGVSGGDIYMQTGGTGNFVALGQTSRSWRGMAAAPNGAVYACVFNDDIYRQGGGDLNGGTLTISSGQSKGSGTSTINFQTATTSGGGGTSLNTLSTKMTILGSGNVGIGTTAPTATLQVGESGASATLTYVDGNEGASKVLTSDASGGATWQDIPNTGHVIFTPLTGASISLTNNLINIVNPAGTIAALTITFPDSPANNDFVKVSFEQVVTTVTYAAGTGGATINGQINGTVGGQKQWDYDSGTNTWY